MDGFGDVVLNEISQTERTNTIWYHLCVESKKRQTRNKECKMMPGASGKWGDVG